MPSIRKQLKRARDDHRLVVIKRRKGWQQIQGYVVQVGPEWIEVLTINDALYDGHAALRVKDIRTISGPWSSSTLTRRVLKHDGAWPPESRGLDVDSTRALLISAGFAHHVITVAREKAKPGFFVAGNASGLTKKWFYLWDLGPRGRWRDVEAAIRLEELTKLTVGGPYLTKVRQVADAHEKRSS